mmetsp:Transcript_55322/g.168189  ORF Transcript_55322/g.168189 Transcript_55322/m.168189 type:complete len:306 (+) Transcript_55322:1108-2025(+)
MKAAEATKAPCLHHSVMETSVSTKLTTKPTMHTAGAQPAGYHFHKRPVSTMARMMNNAELPSSPATHASGRRSPGFSRLPTWYFSKHAAFATIAASTSQTHCMTAKPAANTLAAEPRTSNTALGTKRYTNHSRMRMKNFSTGHEDAAPLAQPLRPKMRRKAKMLTAAASTRHTSCWDQHSAVAASLIGWHWQTPTSRSQEEYFHSQGAESPWGGCKANHNAKLNAVTCSHHRTQRAPLAEFTSPAKASLQQPAAQHVPKHEPQRARGAEATPPIARPLGMPCSHTSGRPEGCRAMEMAQRRSDAA